MKKLLIALAILAVASVAQAELLATWSTATGTVTDGADGATVSSLSLYGSAAYTGATYVWGMNGLDVAGNGMQFTVSAITPGNHIENAVITGSYSGSGTGPRLLDWYVGATLVANVIRTNTGGTGTFGDGSGSTLGTINSGDVVSLRSDPTGGTVRSGVSDPVGAAGSFYITTAGGGMKLNGDITPIPEPATMSLLGLGALAMVLRRKMKK